ncbi:MAG: NAD(P)/FAD-dependent oxidoreductase [Spirochaetales bacterium]
MKTRCDVIVIGAGMSGLLAARTLVEQGIDVIVLDKGRGVGGRMATRRHAGGSFDHGAQFLTVRSPRFQNLVDEWLEQGVAALWSHGFADGKTGDGSLLTGSDGVGGSHMPARDGHPRYRGKPGMTAIPKHIASSGKTLDVRLGVKATAIESAAAGVRVVAEAGRAYIADVAVVTPPVPQSLALLEAGGIDLLSSERDELARISYDPCLVLLGFVDDLSLPAPGAVRYVNESIEWIADNAQKGVSERTGSVTAHFASDWSESRYDLPDEEILKSMVLEAERMLGHPIRDPQLKKWRYSRTRSAREEGAHRLEGNGRIILAGDAFSGNRVEGAALSGLEAARTVVRPAP